MEKIIIERLGVPNFDFVGEIIGQSSGPNPRIKIYRTEGKLFVVQLNANQKFSEAEQFDKPDGVVNWLRDVDPATAEWESAVEDAASHDDSFHKLWNVDIS